jgi:undecaprenyl pyrophosphate phosphatase UppP
MIKDQIFKFTFFLTKPARKSNSLFRMQQHDIVCSFKQLKERVFGALESATNSLVSFFVLLVLIKRAIRGAALC